jgi:hypothetical protein
VTGRRLAGLGFLLCGLAVPGWGYWHASTHGALTVAVHDVALRTERQLYGGVIAADVEFLDGAQGVLARGTLTPPFGVWQASYPETGDCSEVERRAASDPSARAAWQVCFETVSRWLVTWVRQTRFATVTLPACRIERVPVVLRVSGDTWWLWWVPNPHIGGRPYTYFDLSMTLDSGRCAPAAARS